MMAKLDVHVGSNFKEMGDRFVSAWNRAQNGQVVDERHLSFETLEQASRVLSPKRIALLRHLHGSPALNVRALADALGRDYKNVHVDVQALIDAGALDRDDAGALRADFDAIRVEMQVAL